MQIIVRITAFTAVLIAITISVGKKLTFEEIEHEMQVIAKTGMEEILILTGESRAYSDVKYIGEAVKIARKYFKNIGIEIYPVNVDEYQVSS